MTTLPYSTVPGDIDRAIVDDHDVVRAVFGHLERGSGNRQVLAEQAVFFLSLHTAAEEAVLYPAIAATGSERLAEHARHAHRRMKRNAQTVLRGSPGHARFDRALEELIDEVSDHAAEEETWLGRLREAVGHQSMSELGERFAAAKLTASTRPHPHAPSTNGLGRLTGILTGAADRVRDLSSNRQQRVGTDGSGLLDPQAQQLADAFGALNPLPLDALPPTLARRQPTIAEVMKAALAGRRLTIGSSVVVEDQQVPAAEDHPPIPVRMYRRHDLDDAHLPPAIIYAHGGGWVLGDLDAYDQSARALADHVPAVVVSVDYRLAPEHPLPAAHGDLLEAAMWVLRQSEQLGVDADRYALCGEDAGANMAATTCIDLAALSFPRPSLAVLITPIASSAQDFDSFAEHADAQPFTRPTLSWCLHHLFGPEPDNVRDLRFELLARTPEDLRHLPPTVVVTAERDVLRDQGRALADRLTVAGVDTAPLHYDGVGHDFFGTGLVDEHAARAQREVAARLRTALWADDA